MRATIELDDELLEAARTAARERNQPVEVFVADVLRERLLARPADDDVRVGLLPVRPDEPPVTHELIQRLMDKTE